MYLSNVSLHLFTIYLARFSGCLASSVYSCHSILECYNLSYGVKLSIRSFRFIIVSSVVDIRRLYFQSGVDNKPTVFLFTDTQVLEESFLEDINNILSSGEVPNLYKPDEFEEVKRCFLFTLYTLPLLRHLYEGLSFF